jgi:hypothetical protein
MAMEEATRLLNSTKRLRRAILYLSECLLAHLIFCNLWMFVVWTFEESLWKRCLGFNDIEQARFPKGLFHSSPECLYASEHSERIRCRACSWVKPIQTQHGAGDVNYKTGNSHHPSVPWGFLHLIFPACHTSYDPSSASKSFSSQKAP